MRSCFFAGVFVAAVAATCAAQSVFPSPSMKLADVKHKQPKSGVQLGPGNTLTIQQGVGTPTTINVLSFSGDGKRLAAGKDFGRVVVWDLASRKVICAADTNQGIVHAVALSLDGSVMVTGGEGDGFSMKQWSVPDCRPAKTITRLDGYAREAVFGPKGDWFIVTDNAGATHVFDTKSGADLVDMKGNFAPSLSSDGTTLLTVNKESFILWSTANWKQLRVLPRLPQIAIPFALNADADQFVVSVGPAIRILRLSTGEVLSTPQNPPLPKFNAAAGGFASFVAHTPILVGHSDDRVWAWDSSTGQTCTSDFMYSESGVLSNDGILLAAAKDNSILARDRLDDGVWIWNTRDLAAKCGFKVEED